MALHWANLNKVGLKKFAAIFDQKVCSLISLGNILVKDTDETFEKPASLFKGKTNINVLTFSLNSSRKIVKNRQKID